MRKLGMEGDQGDTVTSIIKTTRKCGNIALIGDFFFNTNQFPIGMLMEKTITLRGGQLMAQKVVFRGFIRIRSMLTMISQYFPYLLDIVVAGQYDPSFVVTHTGVYTPHRWHEASHD
jgi:threonine dehydrogenase-like Zn-dependent dehydrogenase